MNNKLEIQVFFITFLIFGIIVYMVTAETANSYHIFGDSSVFKFLSTNILNDKDK